MVIGGPGFRRLIVFDIPIRLCITPLLTPIKGALPMSALLKLIATAAIATAIASPSIAQEQPKPKAATSVHYPNLRRPVTWITGMPTAQQSSNVIRSTTTITCHD